MPLIPAYRGRFAPSPSGALHAGNIQTALFAWLHARRHNGIFALRIEDTDLPRSRPGSAQSIMDDLQWLGLDWDEGPYVGGAYGPYWQSQREDIYRAYLQRLYAMDMLYPCDCTRAMRRLSDSAADTADQCRCAARPASHIKLSDFLTGAYAWKVRVANIPVQFEDLRLGSVQTTTALYRKDFIARRSDSVFAYQLAVVVDDALMRISHVIRGEDLVEATPGQIALYQLLKFPIPQFLHTPLVRDTQNHKLAKRNGAEGVQHMRLSGSDPRSVLGQIAYNAGLLPENIPISAAELLNSVQQKIC